MVKAYLRYEAEAAFGVITSSSVLWTYDYVVTAALSDICLWNVKHSSLVATLKAPATSVGRKPGDISILAASPSGRQLAAGHSDGAIRLWNLDTRECEVTFTGHRRRVTALRFNEAGSILASGAQDTDIILWDTAGETGLCRLQGHTDQVNDLAFLERRSVLVSGGKDGHVRLWDLQTQHCFQTLTSAGEEVWALDADAAGERVVVGGTHPALQVYTLPEVSISGAAAGEGVGTIAEPLAEAKPLERRSGERVARLRFSPDGSLLACQGAGKTLELFRVRSKAEAARQTSRRRKRKREKAKQAGHGDTGAEAEEDDSPVAQDEFAALPALQNAHKLKAFAFQPRRGSLADAPQLALSLANNSIQVWRTGAEERVLLRSIEMHGHRAGVRAVALSSDEALALVCAGPQVKVWHLRSRNPLRTLEVGHGLCAMFAPGDRHAVVGTKEGTLHVLDVEAGAAVVLEAAHGGAVWAVVPLPDASGLVSCSSDHHVALWEWEARTDAATGTRQLGMHKVRSFKADEDILSARVSPDGRLLALALLDSTVQVYFMDTFKFFLSLYGHKLPVLSMDISSDSMLLVSGSADKSIKIWGLDFGDCHKSLFAHGDSVMQVLFVPDTHYVFTLGKDHLVKFWDADRWELLLTLEGHHAEVWCGAISKTGDLLVTGSADRSVRMWRRTSDVFFVEEEREKHLDSLFEANIAGEGEDANKHQEGREDGASAAAGRRTAEAATAADRIADALELALAETSGTKADGPSSANPLLLGMPADKYLLKAVSTVRPAELEQALLLLPFSHALQLLTFLCGWLRTRSQVELVSRVSVLLVRLHHERLVATPSTRQLLLEMNELLHASLTQVKDTMGLNLAAVQHLQHSLKHASSTLPVLQDVGVV